MARSILFSAIAGAVVAAGTLAGAGSAEAQYYYYPNQPYYAPHPGYGYGYRPQPPVVYYDKETAKSIARNWKEQQKARIKSGYYYQQPQYYAPAPRYRQPRGYYQGGYYADPGTRWRGDGRGYGPGVVNPAIGPHGHGG